MDDVEDKEFTKLKDNKNKMLFSTHRDEFIIIWIPYVWVNSIQDAVELVKVRSNCMVSRNLLGVSWGDLKHQERKTNKKQQKNKTSDYFGKKKLDIVSQWWNK